VTVDESGHYLNRRSPGKTVLDLIREHFEELDRWSLDLVEVD